MTTMKYPHFLSSEIENTSPQEAYFHVIPVAFEFSVSYGTGTKFGPSAILEASDQLELYDAYTNSSPALRGIHTQTAIDEAEPIAMLNVLSQATTEALEVGAMPVILGGEHSISYGALRAIKEKIPHFGIIHIDAHADLRDSYEGTKWSHASAMKRALELDIPIVQFGTRAYCEEEKQARIEHSVTAYDAHCFMNSASYLPNNVSEQNLLPENFPEKVYLSFDVDGLDPSIIPHTGTPVPGGLQWYQTLELIRCILKTRQLIGFDVVELAPTENSQMSDFATANLVYKIMGLSIENCNNL